MYLRNLLVGIAAVSLGLIGCASPPTLTAEQAAAQNQSIAQLEQALNSARERKHDILAPEGFTAAGEHLSDARAAAGKGQADAATRAAESGKARLQEAERNARTTAEVLSEVLSQRERALQAGARELFPGDLEKADAALRESAALVERDDLEATKRNRPRLKESYATLELKTLKESTIQRAREAIAQARSNDAHKLAPKTFGNAEESLRVALSVLEADRTARARADASAQQSVSQAQRSEQVAEIVRDYDRRDFTPEEIVLWYQDQLSEVVAPVVADLTFTDSNDKTVAALRERIATLVGQRQRLAEDGTELARLKAEHAKEIEKLKQQFAEERAQMAMAQQEREERFAFIQGLFGRDEATVYRQAENVLVSVHGFKFPTGSSEIRPDNFGVMNKIIQSIKTFNSSKVRIAGHTDATGGDNLNLNLSAQRAASVAKFLVDVGRIPANTISAQGFGSQRPVATNATPEGRAQNRRIEVLIVNE